MTTERTCPECGAARVADCAGGLCPACLLKQGLRTDGAPDGTQIMESPKALPLEEVAARFPRIEVLELLGVGGMGVVYKARQPRLDRLVALKILPAAIAAEPEFAERFAREARALARLNHPNIVGVYDFGQADDLFYFMMEYVDGATLRQMERSGKLSPAEALGIIPPLCDALQYAHDEGIVHRDIKPENILVDRKGRVKIADFGLAKLLGKAPSDVTLTRADAVMGTPRYMAPEQMETPLSVDHRADIYSLGVVFYEMLTGELPMGRFAPPSRKAHVDVRLDEVVLKTLEKEPARRYQHASEIKSDVEGLSAARGAAVDAPLPPPAMLRSHVRAPAIGLMATAMVNWLALPVVLAAMYGYARGHETSPPPVAVLACIILMAASGLILWGALKMLRGESFGMARAAAILAMLVGPGYLVGWPVGIWALAVLARREVRAAFADTPPSGPMAPSSPVPVVSLIGLGAALGGLIVPVLLCLAGFFLEFGLDLSYGYYGLCVMLGVLSEVAALGCGIAGRRSTEGRAALTIAGIVLLLCLLTGLWLMPAKAMPIPAPHETVPLP